MHFDGEVGKSCLSFFTNLRLNFPLIYEGQETLEPCFEAFLTLGTKSPRFIMTAAGFALGSTVQ